MTVCMRARASSSCVCVVRVLLLFVTLTINKLIIICHESVLHFMLVPCMYASQLPPTKWGLARETKSHAGPLDMITNSK